MRPRGRTHPGPGSRPSRYPGTFLLAFREVLEEMSWQALSWRGHQVECVDPQGRSQVVGLENLYRQVRREPREQWLTLIREFLHAATVGDAAQLLPDELATVADQ